MNNNYHHIEEDFDNEDIEDMKKGKMPISRLVPNIVTILALCFGLTSIKMAMSEKWELAIMFIIIASFLDAIDGRLARLLKATSQFGAQLDSFSDFLNFGIAPSITIYLWSLKNINNTIFGWGIVVFFVVCCAIRLARFNVALDDEKTKNLGKIFFIGLPSPAAALIVLIPLMLFVEYNYVISPKLYSVILAVIGFLMPSRIPFFSGKKVKFNQKFTSLVMVFVGFLIGMVLLEPWVTLPILGTLYLLSMPFSVYYYNKYEKAYKAD